MKASDYIVGFFEKKGLRHAFGYQGTMIMHFIDSLGKSDLIENHSCYNEQAAAFAACGYAKLTGECALAYATSGPGAINLVSGIADAYYDSAPVIFITGQVNTYDYQDTENIRQHAFQQTPTTDITASVAKKVYFVDRAEMIPDVLNEAWDIAMSGRKGPVVLDIPMNIQREETVDEIKEGTVSEAVRPEEADADYILEQLEKAERPLIIVGNGIGKTVSSRKNIVELVEKTDAAAISTLLGSDIFANDHKNYFGTLGYAYGHRYANIISCEKADLIVSLGASLCTRQTGGKPELFAKNARIIRVDVDETELSRPVHKENEVRIHSDADLMIEAMLRKDPSYEHKEWIGKCSRIKESLQKFDRDLNREPNNFIELISDIIPSDSVVAVDVGQHMMWSLQSFNNKGQRVLYSGGHGAMGFALPAAIGACYVSPGKPVFSIAGDGAMQMNIQELQWVKREGLPITIIVFNNQALGLIRQQQTDFFDSRFFGALDSGGFNSPDFTKIAQAYGINSHKVKTAEELSAILNDKDRPLPELIEIILPDTTSALPKTYFGDPMTNQKPYITEALKKELEEL